MKIGSELKVVTDENWWQTENGSEWKLTANGNSFGSAQPSCMQKLVADRKWQ